MNIDPALKRRGHAPPPARGGTAPPGAPYGASPENAMRSEAYQQQLLMGASSSEAQLMLEGGMGMGGGGYGGTMDGMMMGGGMGEMMMQPSYEYADPMANLPSAAPPLPLPGYSQTAELMSAPAPANPFGQPTFVHPSAAVFAQRLMSGIAARHHSPSLAMPMSPFMSPNSSPPDMSPMMAAAGVSPPLSPMPPLTNLPPMMGGNGTFSPMSPSMHAQANMLPPSQSGHQLRSMAPAPPSSLSPVFAQNAIAQQQKFTAQFMLAAASKLKSMPPPAVNNNFFMQTRALQQLEMDKLYKGMQPQEMAVPVRGHMTPPPQPLLQANVPMEAYSSPMFNPRAQYN